eukprot:g36136.t1
MLRAGRFLTMKAINSWSAQFPKKMASSLPRFTLDSDASSNQSQVLMSLYTDSRSAKCREALTCRPPLLGMVTAVRIASFLMDSAKGLTRQAGIHSVILHISDCIPEEDEAVRDRPTWYNSKTDLTQLVMTLDRTLPLSRELSLCTFWKKKHVHVSLCCMVRTLDQMIIFGDLHNKEQDLLAVHLEILCDIDPHCLQQ